MACFILLSSCPCILLCWDLQSQLSILITHKYYILDGISIVYGNNSIQTEINIVLADVPVSLPFLYNITFATGSLPKKAKSKNRETVMNVRDSLLICTKHREFLDLHCTYT